MLNNTFSQINSEFVLMLANGVIYLPYSLSNLTFSNIKTSESAILLDNAKASFQYLSMTNISQVQNSSSFQTENPGLCILSSQSIVSINSSCFTSIAGPCLAFFSSFPLVNASVFDNSQVNSYTPISNIPTSLVSKSSFITIGSIKTFPVSQMMKTTLQPSKIYYCTFKNNTLHPKKGGAIRILSNTPYQNGLYIQNNTFSGL